MKTHFKFVTLAGLMALAISCKKEAESDAAEMSDTTNIETRTAVSKDLPARQFIRTADIRFRVKDVAKSTESIESTARRFGGFVTYTNLRSNVHERKNVAVSLDSLVETTRYSVENTITLRVPNHELDTILTTICRQAAFLDIREIKAEDAALNILSQQLTQRRNVQHGRRLTDDVDTKRGKLNDIVGVEDKVASRKEAADEAYLSELSLRDRVAFSTVTLAIYQNESLKTELLPNISNADSFRPHFGISMLESAKTGWYLLERVLLFFIGIWPVLMIVVFALLLNRKRLVKKIA